MSESSIAVTKQTQRRDTLTTLLWPEASQQKARTSLRRELYALINAIGDKWLTTTRNEIGLVPDADIWVDVEKFRHQLATCDSHKHLSGDPCGDWASSLGTKQLSANRGISDSID